MTNSSVAGDSKLIVANFFNFFSSILWHCADIIFEYEEQVYIIDEM